MKRKITLLTMILVSINALATSSCPTPSITMNPTSFNSCGGQVALFSIAASGNSLTYQWQVDQGSGFTDLSNAPPYGAVTSNLLNLSFVSATFNGYQYRCVITDSCAQVITSTAATLSVNTSPIVTATASGSTITVSITGGAPPYTGDAPGTYTGLYPGIYTYLITDLNGCTGSATATISAPPTSCPTPNITQNPVPFSVCTGQVAPFGVMANGTGLTYQWQVNSGSGFTDLGNSNPYSGVTSNSLLISSVPFTLNSYQYRCVITDSCAQITTSGAATLTVTTAIIVTVNSSTIFSGQTAVLTASGATSYTWTTGAFTNSISVSPTFSTSYNVTGTTSGCSNTAIATVTVTDTTIGIGARGATGITGTTGVTGFTGTTGASGVTGATGADGIQGATGISGNNGTIGATGITGAQGVQGNTGIIGATGADGIQGATGLNGTTGAKGTDGIQGTTGITGATGAVGATGVTGAQGVQGNIGAIGTTGFTGADGALSAWGKGGTTGTNPATDFLGTTDAAALAFRTNNIERIRILPSGSIGVGTATPITIGKVVQVSSSDANGTSMLLENTVTGGKNWRMLSCGTTNTGGAGSFMIVNHTDDPANPKLMITASGNIGMGTATPNSIGKTLHVASTNIQGTSLFLENSKSWRMLSTGTGNTGGSGNLLILNHSDDAVNPKFMISSSGNIGIGTAAPSAKADIAGNLRIQSVAQNNTAAKVLVADATGIVGYRDATTLTGATGAAGAPGADGALNAWSFTGTANTNPAVNFIGTTDNVDVVLKTNNAEVLRLAAGGNVGIGTSSPQAKLDVNGNAKIANDLTVGGNISFAGNKQISFTPASGTLGDVYSFGGPPRLQGLPSCFPSVNLLTSSQFQGLIQLFDGTHPQNSFSQLVMGWDGANGIIDLASSDPSSALYLNHWCGKDVNICGGNGGSDGNNNPNGSCGNVAMCTPTSGCVTIGTFATPAPTTKIKFEVENGFAHFAYNTQALPSPSDHGGLSIGWNRMNGATGPGGQAEVDFYNVFANPDPINSPTTAFQFSQLKGSGATDVNDLMTIKSNGSVGIGTPLTTNPNSYILAVNGLIGAKELKIETNSTTWWPDYVFDKNYSLLPLNELEKYLHKNKHLPNIPSAENVKNDNGVLVGDMQTKLLQKVEELTLYIIEQNKRIEVQNKRIETLEKRSK